MKNRRRPLLRLAPAAVIGLLAACASPPVVDHAADVVPDDSACVQLHGYGRFPGRTVSVLAGFIPPDDQPYRRSFETFQRCTGITIKYEGSNDLEGELRSRIESGDAPDIAFIPQPGLLGDLVATGAVKRAPKAVEQLVDRDWSKDWKNYGTVKGTFYAAPAGAYVKSLIWYSPRFFADNGLTPPTTWSDLMALTQRLTQTKTLKGVGPNFKPWCAGFRSGSASGWPGTDWVEDLLLHSAGPQVYDRWTDHTIPFDAPEVRTAFDLAGSILKSDKYVNGGATGGVRSINSTTFQNGGQGLLHNECALHHQASFYSQQWPRGTSIGKNGVATASVPADTVYAFPTPAIDPDQSQSVLGAGEFVAAFSDRPAVQAFQTFLASPQWVNERAQLGNWTSADRSLNADRMSDDVQKLSAVQLANPRTTFRFDASDRMPAKVGAGTFWTGITRWINGASTAQVLQQIESSWPPSP